MKPTFLINTLIFLSLLLGLISCQDVAKSSYLSLPEFCDYRLLKINGSVKSMTLSVFNSKDSLIRESSFFFNKKRQTIEKQFEVFGTNVSHQYLFNSEGERYIFKRFEDGKLVTNNRWVDSLDNNGNPIKKRTYDINKQLTNKITFSYSTEGKLLLRKSSSSNSIWIDSFFYNKEDQLIKSSFTKLNSDPSLQERIFTAYNFRENKVSEITYFGNNEFDSKEVFNYDSLGHLIEQKSYSHDTTFYNKKSLIHYNTAGLKTDSIHQYFQFVETKNQDSIKAYQTEIFWFNTQADRKTGLLAKKEVTYSEGFIEVLYDNMGNEISTQYFNKKKILRYTNQNKITYDAKNNIVEIQIFKAGKLETVVKRNYEYY